MRVSTYSFVGLATGKFSVHSRQREETFCPDIRPRKEIPVSYLEGYEILVVVSYVGFPIVEKN